MPPRLLSQPAEVGEGRFAALVVAGERAPPRHAPHGSLVEEFGERLHVSRVEGVVIEKAAQPVRVSYYNMLVEIHPSARRHEVSDEDIEHAVDNAMVIEDRDDDTRLYLAPAAARRCSRS